MPEKAILKSTTMLPKKMKAAVVHAFGQPLIGGLGHLAVQYAIAMGLQVAAIDISDDKLELAKKLGATLVVNARKQDPGEYLKKEVGGMHGVLADYSPRQHRGHPPGPAGGHRFRGGR